MDVEHFHVATCRTFSSDGIEHFPVPRSQIEPFTNLLNIALVVFPIKNARQKVNKQARAAPFAHIDANPIKKDKLLKIFVLIVFSEANPFTDLPPLNIVFC